MLFKKGDWVWFMWKHGVELLPVGSGMPYISIAPRWTTGLGLLITEKGLVQKGPSIYSTLALATTDNRICIDFKGNEYIYLTSFKQEDLCKRFGYHNRSIAEMIKDATITQLNPDFDHYGFETKRRLDRDTIHFIKKWLEDKPMKADNKVKSVKATFKVDSHKRGTDLDKVATETTFEDGTTKTEKVKVPPSKKVLTRVESFKARRLQPGDKVPIWKFVKNHIEIINGDKKKITRINKWIITGYREIPQPIVINAPPFVYKVPRAIKLKITPDTIRERYCLPSGPPALRRDRGKMKTFKGKIDKKVFSGNIILASWRPMPDQVHHFVDAPKKNNVGIKTFYLVQRRVAKHTSAVGEELKKLTEIKMLKYPGRDMTDFIRKELAS